MFAHGRRDQCRRRQRGKQIKTVANMEPFRSSTPLHTDDGGWCPCHPMTAGATTGMNGDEQLAPTRKPSPKKEISCSNSPFFGLSISFCWTDPFMIFMILLVVFLFSRRLLNHGPTGF